MHFQASGPPPLFPPMKIMAPAAITDDEVYLVQKYRDVIQRCQDSPYFLLANKRDDDIARYEFVLKINVHTRVCYTKTLSFFHPQGTLTNTEAACLMPRS